MYMFMSSLQSVLFLAAQVVHCIPTLGRLMTFCFENENIDLYRGTQQTDRQTDMMSHPEHEINQSNFFLYS